MTVVRLYNMLILLLLPTRIARILILSRQIRISRGARIGLSLVDVDRLTLDENSRIGHLNVIKGSFGLILSNNAGIGHMNLILRSRLEGPTTADLRVGIWSKITGGHRVDVTRSITIGNYSTIAGHGSQLWTHGYVHGDEGLDRYRLDGAIRIGNNVSIGSGCIISMGVSIADRILIGAGATVAKDLDEPALYVAAGLRKLSKPVDPVERGLSVVQSNSGDIVYLRRAD